MIRCTLCPSDVVSLDALLSHLSSVHHISEDFSRWSDGSPVVVDHTLTPEEAA